MIRIAHLSDSHFDERGRLQDVVDVHQAFLDQVTDADVDLIVHAGDFFERRSTPAERTALARFLQEAAEIAPFVGVKGNHDAAGDLEIFNRLDADCLVCIVERPADAPIVRPSSSLAFGLLALPWFDKAHLVAGLDATVDAEASRQMTIAAARQLLVGLRAQADSMKRQGIIPILAGHVLVGGSEVSTGQVLIGTTVELAPGDLADVGATYCALGHVHKTQEWYGGRVAYSGSVNRCNFGESEAKGWRLVTLTDAGEFVSNEFKELPARRMLLLEGTLDPEKLVIAGACDVIGMGAEGWDRAEVDGALVRFRYHVRAQDLHLVDDDAIERALRADGAVDVQIEAVVEHENRVRSTEISAAATTWEKADAFFKAKGVQLEDAQRERLQSKLGELEGAHA
jgi:exonuclease SbcD